MGVQLFSQTVVLKSKLKVNLFNRTTVRLFPASMTVCLTESYRNAEIVVHASNPQQIVHFDGSYCTLIYGSYYNRHYLFTVSS